MPRDTFVRFTIMPERSKISETIRSYVSIARAVHWDRDRWFIDLPGGPEDLPGKQPTRWIEVWPGSDCVDVMTRPQTDEFTVVVADGLAKRLARVFDGTLGDVP